MIMTIHHDKLAYGKLQKTSEELSEEQILKMLAELKDGDKEEPQNKDKEGGRKSKKEAE